MITHVMQEALRRRGLVDDAIAKLTPEEAHRVLLTPDERTVRRFSAILVALAKKSLGGHPPPGCLQLSRKHPSSEDLVPSRYRLDRADLIERLTRDAIADSEAGHNVFLEGRLVNFDLRGKTRGGLEDTACVFALVVDSDADRGMGWTPPASMRPTMAIETSPGNHQFWFFLDQAVGREQARELGARLRRATGSDHDTGTPTQPYRVPGLANYPNQTKLKRGRVAAPTSFHEAMP